MSFEEEVDLAEDLAREFGLRNENSEPDPEPEMQPGQDVGAAIGRIRVWLEQYPDDISVAGQIGSSEKYRSPGWPYRLYAVDRRDLMAVLDAAEEGMKKQ